MSQSDLEGIADDAPGELNRTVAAAIGGAGVNVEAACGAVGLGLSVEVGFAAAMIEGLALLLLQATKYMQPSIDVTVAKRFIRLIFNPARGDLPVVQIASDINRWSSE